jgi:uncharacterized protein with FMN-binding domain
MRRVILAIVCTAAVLALVLSFKTRTQPAVAPPAPGRPPASTAGGPATTVTGDVVQTVYGPVQVRITVAGGQVTAVTAPQYPQDTPRDDQINEYAIPRLNSEAVAAGSADIDAVSGATYTSQGYVGSLQSALDKAGR